MPVQKNEYEYRIKGDAFAVYKNDSEIAVCKKKLDALEILGALQIREGIKRGLTTIIAGVGDLLIDKKKDGG